MCQLQQREVVFDVKELEDKGEDGKSKAMPVQAWTGPEDSRRLSLPYLKTVDT
jgi:hypothetical protein